MNRHHIVIGKYIGLLALFFVLVINLCGCASAVVEKKKNRPVKEPAPLITGCDPSLKSNCRATQKEMNKSFLAALNKYGLGGESVEQEGGPAALTVLPKDKYGNVNWTKAAMDGLIRPRGSIEENGAEDKPFNMIVLFQVRVQIMADVLFPHSVHTYWLSCSSCHPKIFKPEVGSNKVSMTDINNGLFCGKCHGKVAFPIEPDPVNCRRCHFFLKKLNT